MLNLRASFAAFGIGVAKLFASVRVLAMTAVFAMVSHNLPAIYAQSFPVVFDGDSLTIEYPTDLVVRSDRGFHNEETRRSLTSFLLPDPGYVLVFCQVEYSEDQLNESFFVDMCSVGDGNCTQPCGTNAGDLFVVADHDTENLNIVRFAGRFFLENGTYDVFLNHYADIISEFPDFWVCVEGQDCEPGVSVTPESVHLKRLVLVRELETVYDAGINKRAGADSVQRGERVDFELEVRNFSASTIYEVNVRDEISGLRNIDYNWPPADDLAGVASWHLDSLAAGETVVIGYSGEPEFDDGDRFVAGASVSAFCDGNPANDTTLCKVRRYEPALRYDLALQLSSSPDSVFAGQRIYLDLYVRNDGPDNASGFQVVLSRPMDVTYLPVDFPDYSDAGDSLIFTFAGLGTAETVHLRIVAQVGQEAEVFCPSMETFSAVLTAPNDQLDSNNRAQTTAYLRCRPSDSEEPIEDPAYDLEVNKSASASRIEPDESVVYRLVVQNLGPIPASEVILVDLLPPELRVLAAFPNDYANTDGNLSWSLPPIPAGDSVVVEITTGVTPDSLGDVEELFILNSAFVRAPYDSNATNDSSAVQIVCENKQPPEEPPVVEPPVVPSRTPGKFECIELDRNVFAPELDGMLTITFSLPAPVNVSINMFDLAGTFVTNIVEGPFQQGEHTVQWSGLSRGGEKVGSGVYVMIFEAPSFKKCIQKVIVAR